MKTAYLFSGQGAQYAGMGRDIAENYTSAGQFYDKAAAILAWQPLDLTAEELQDTLFAQPATVCLSLAIWDLLVQTDEYVLGGFSLGEYTAFGASGLLDHESLIRLVAKRARVMSEAAQHKPGKMIAVLGLPDETIEDLLHTKYEGKVWPVNYNCPGQLVIAGSTAETDEAAAELKSLGAKRLVPLQVSGAFHTPLMEDAAAELKGYAEQNLVFHQPHTYDIYSNASAQLLTEEEVHAFPDYLAHHMTHEVRWTETIEAMYASGVRRFVEIGPGKTLRGLVQKILKGKEDVEISNIGTAAELSAVLNPS